MVPLESLRTTSRALNAVFDTHGGPATEHRFKVLKAGGRWVTGRNVHMIVYVSNGRILVNEAVRELGGLDILVNNAA